MHLIPSRFRTSSTLDTSTYESQSAKLETVGGHSENFSVHDGFITKKTNQTEAAFYSRLMGKPYEIASYVPQCTTVTYDLQTSVKKHEQGFAQVTLEDLRYGFKKPVLFDIKLGTKTVSYKELSAAGTARSNIMRKDISLHVADAVTTSSKRGYRFVGSSLAQQSRFHLGTHADEMIEELASRVSKNDLVSIVQQLENLLRYLKTKEGRRFEFIGASVLIIAESDKKTLQHGEPLQPKVKLIDFAHTHVAGGKGLLLDNKIVLTPHRKQKFQKGLRLGLSNLIDDVQMTLDAD